MRPDTEDDSTGAYPYKAINAIIISWREDDLDIETELFELKGAFHSLNFTSIDMYYIPFQGSFDALSDELRTQKRKAADEQALLVVYYGGHGRLSTNRRLRIAATNEAGCPTLDWNAIQATLEHASVDVFLILDCCNASAAAASFEMESEDFPEATNRLEILAGCGYDAVTRAAGRYSFTAALTRELTKQSKRETIFSVAQLYQSLHAKMLRQHPSNIPDSHEDEYKNCFVAPLYIPRCVDYNHVSIPLRKLDTPVIGTNASFENGRFVPGVWESAPLETSIVSSDCLTPNTESSAETLIGSWSESGYVWNPIDNGKIEEIKAACFQNFGTDDRSNYWSVLGLTETLSCAHIEEGIGGGIINW